MPVASSPPRLRETKLDSPAAIVDKRRVDIDVSEGVASDRRRARRTTLIIDDILTPGHAGKNGGGIAEKKARPKVYAACTARRASDPPSSASASRPIEEVVVTDSVTAHRKRQRVPRNQVVLSVAGPLAARYLLDSRRDFPISELFFFLTADRRNATCVSAGPNGNETRKSYGPDHCRSSAPGNSGKKMQRGACAFTGKSLP